MKRLPLLLLLTLTSATVSAQAFLYLKKLGGKQEVKFFKGEEIRFQLRGDEYFVSGQIEGFGVEAFIVHGTEVSLKDVDRYDIRNKRTSGFDYQTSSAVMLTAGIALPLVDLGNQFIVEGRDRVRLHPSIIITSASLIVGSFIIRWLEPRYFVPGRKKRAIIVAM
ncbi:MAG: hypothetical protein AAGA85_16090 [Bacteroidota bacterium]